MQKFSHLHVHTQFSLLDGAADIGKLFKKAAKDGMPALAITDHGNMFGAFQFVAEAYKHKLNPDDKNDNRLKVKPIVGCEFYLVENRHKKQFSKEDKDKRYHQLFLAKDEEGYRNLTKLCSLGFIEGMYSKYPRIDKELVLQYHKGLIATTCCIGASVPKAILRKSEAEAEKEFKWWLDVFGEDYYVELQRHHMKEQDRVNEVLSGFAAKYNVKIIASNDSHYVDQQDSNAHDILLCLNTGEKQSTPSSKDFSDDEVTPKGTRFAFFNDQFYFKTQAEMNHLFSDLPHALDNTNEVVDKIKQLDLKRDILLPNFPVPPEFSSQDDYLYHLTYTGAKARYGDILPEVEERIKFELHTIKTMGFAGYFLIVADFIKAGRDLGVFVGPGRGSAAGSAVAYCIGITNIDPIKYNLLFERFLNPDRKSMPDIDTDFDDEGRQKVIDYVVQKYGRNQVAQIVTYGTMAAKMSIKDVARVMDLSLPESNLLTKLVPDKPGITLDRVMNAPLEGEKSLKEKEGLQSEDLENVKKLREIGKGDDLQAMVLKEALILEGSVRGTGIHAAGIIIAPNDLSDLIPVATAKDSELLITQYEGKVIEDAGVIKMDFLGLKTLTIIKKALSLIRKNHGIDIDPDSIPLDDLKTYELYQRGETNGTFQFESVGMQKYLKELKPDAFGDLIAMNALYRPGPIAYIPKFIKRKLGLEPITYDVPEMEEYLADTYGITVYQEQVMLLSQKLAGFTKGDADVLRKAMGKKDRSTLDKMKGKFMEGASAKGQPADKLEKIWTDWEAFAQYAFNKSHSTCYAFVAFQTAYLKANYPGEYMAAVLTNNLSNLEKLTFFLDECRRMGVKVLGPDINESELEFSVNKKGEIRVGLGALKGIGEAAVAAIIEERNINGPYKSVFELTARASLRTVNKKALESLALAGAFDSLGKYTRAQYVNIGADGMSGVEKAIRYGNAQQENESSSQASLFGDSVETSSVTEPAITACEQWSPLEQLMKERDVVGIYITGHPLDEYRIEIDNFCSHKLSDLSEIEKLKGKDIAIAGIISNAAHRMSKSGKPFGSFSMEDYTGSHSFTLFSEDYLKFKHFINNDMLVFAKAKLQARFQSSTDFEWKITHLQLLAEVRGTLAKSLTLMIKLDDVNEKLINNINNIAQQHPGKCQLIVALSDKEEKLWVELPARKYKVEPSNELFKQIDQLGLLNYKLNKPHGVMDLDETKQPALTEISGIALIEESELLTELID